MLPILPIFRPAIMHEHVGLHIHKKCRWHWVISTIFSSMRSILNKRWQLEWVDFGSLEIHYVEALISCCYSGTKSWPTLATPWTVAYQAPLSSAISWTLLQSMSIDSVILSNHLILCCSLLLLPLVFPSIRVFPMSRLFTSDDQSIGASIIVLTVNIQGWFPLGLITLILQSKGLS